MSPAEAHGLTAIEAAERLATDLQTRGLSMEKDVERVIIRTHAAAKLIIDKNLKLRNHADRDRDLRFMVAVALLKGKAPTADDFSDASPWVESEAVEHIRQTMAVNEDEGFTRDYLDIDTKSLANGVDLLLKNGTRLGERVVRHPRDSLKRDGTASCVRTKTLANLRLVLEEYRVQTIINTIMNTRDVNVTELTDLLWVG